MKLMNNALMLCTILTLLVGCPSMTGSGTDTIWKAPPGLFPDSTPDRPEPDQPKTPETSPQGDWSVLLAEFRAPAPHVAQATNYLKSARDVTKWDSLFVVHEEEVSRVFTGRFATREEAARRVQEIRAWTNPNGVKVFQRALPARVTTELKKTGLEQWEITNAPKDAYYTVVVAIFRDRPNCSRQEGCLYSVRELRKQGVEAWYHHGPNYSALMIGTFPVSAMKVTREAVRHPQTGDISYIERMENQSDEVRKVMDEYPELLVNGLVEKNSEFDPQQGRYVMKARMSYVTVIPGRKIKKPTQTPASGQQPRYWERMR